jgi:hypothetical protein
MVALVNRPLLHLQQISSKVSTIGCSASAAGAAAPQWLSASDCAADRHSRAPACLCKESTGANLCSTAMRPGSDC